MGEKKKVQTYGPIFRELRIAKNLSLKEISKENFSIAQLSRFELQSSDLTFTKILHALDEIEVTPEEFATIVRGYKKHYFEEFSIKLNERYRKQDIPAMKELYKEEMKLSKKHKKRFHELNAITILALIQNLDETFVVSDEDKEKLASYLLNTSKWGVYEMFLFLNTEDILETELIILLTKELISRTAFYHSIQRHQDIIFRILVNTLNFCSERNELGYAKYFLEMIDGFPLPEEALLERNRYVYAKGFYEIKNGNTKEGKKLMETAISVFKNLGCRDLTNLYESYYRKFIDESNNI